ncbi:hypothetical protein Smp_141160 [Schistosoma mansoni]|uniref:hypothetical protein n=1 Tax=Schistosoma mansoni TaxID=6183 RepID=UPI0001A94497|nr:hypothetical protein Smp_141160 [Schistosoma mansoni]|eukprot:XP_018647904.1 hypothetical protein Smp_141160 [Schistosoma mansoni]
MDLTCSICLNVLFRPVHLPCNHQFCKDCIVQALNFTAYQCPICRYRLSNWLRRVKDMDSAVSESKENEIRSLFPNYYDAKESGMSPSLSESEIETLAAKNTDPIPNCFAEPGDVHDYYMKEIEKYSHLRSVEEKENEEASLALAAQLLFEDGLNLPADDILSSGRSKGVKKKCERRQKKKATKTSKTLLDYAVNTAKIGFKPEVANEQVHLNFFSLEF